MCRSYTPLLLLQLVSNFSRKVHEPVLTHDEIKNELELGTIQTSPQIDENQISVASVDLHIANEFRIFRKIVK